eukprot:11013140-Ditylum_brightwellii.AAC.1
MASRLASSLASNIAWSLLGIKGGMELSWDNGIDFGIKDDVVLGCNNSIVQGIKDGMEMA